MKSFSYLLIFVLSLFITLFSCSSKSSKSRKPVSSINFQPQKANYVFGEKIAVNVLTNANGGKIKDIKLYLNNQLLKESKDLNFTVNNIELNKLGSSTFTVWAEKNNGVKNSRFQDLNVLYSNIVPEKLTYQIIKDYPHSKTHYTQGLEFYNNYLYEGTGENGESGLFKIKLETGKIEKSLMMDEKYFGEGITILNNKIYQLTYKHKIGFIYNLSDFALIDSFQFKSNEGWGLTNDGKYLIMSDGTNVLTWLNPNDFSIVKTVQVANNEKVINNLNELEYINGTIYANIYTTNLIVQIDPETGRVLAEINLTGILNKYKSANDKIDYLNGIAYLPNADRLFVTGKYWPRIFEIKLIPSK